MTTEDDWNAFAMELWGLSVATWTPIPERAGRLPEPLEYDTLHDGLVELQAGQRHMVIQCLSCYQAGKMSAEDVLQILRPLASHSKTFSSIFLNEDIDTASETEAEYSNIPRPNIPQRVLLPPKN